MSGTIERSAFRYDGRQDKRETKGVKPHFRGDVENGVEKIKGRVRKVKELGMEVKDGGMRMTRVETV